MQTRKASIKETGEELTSAEWKRFDEAVAQLKAERREEPSEVSPERVPAAKADAQAIV